MFRLTQKPSSVSYNQSFAKITSLVQLCLSVQMLSVLWRHILTWCACVQFTVSSEPLISCMTPSLQYLYYQRVPETKQLKPHTCTCRISGSLGSSYAVCFFSETLCNSSILFRNFMHFKFFCVQLMKYELLHLGEMNVLIFNFGIFNIPSSS